MSAGTWKCDDWRFRFIGMILLTVILVAMFRELLAELVFRWTTEAQYSHGFAIPLIAVGLGWIRRDRLRSGRAEASGLGLILMAVGIFLHVMARYLYIEGVDCLALLMCLSGILILVWGTSFARAMWPMILFPAFMFPLPYRFESLLSDPLQLLGARYSAWLVQCLGIPAIAEGSVIHLAHTQLGVEEACSGIRMLMVFVAISAAAMIVSDRSAWEKTLILFSAIPIALACNIGRIVATAIAHHTLGGKMADLVFHDFSGWLMMPAAMGLLYIELRLLDWLLIDSPDHRTRLSISSGVPGIPATGAAS